MSSAALVGTDGSIDWCCFPRFDSPSIFAAILDSDVGGRFRIGPRSREFESFQEYIEDTNILRTTFMSATGVVSVTDFMPAADDDDDNPETPPKALHEVHRIVTCISGQMEMCCDFQPKHDYSRALPCVQADEGTRRGDCHPSLGRATGNHPPCQPASTIR